MSLIVVDGYSEDNQDAYLHCCVGTEKSSQSFIGKAGNLISCKWYLRKYGSPTGDIVAKLYTHSGTYGVSSVPNSLLATSNSIDITTLSESFNLITFNFEDAEQYLLIEGTYYCKVIEFSGGDYYYNYLMVGLDYSSPTHSGNTANYYYGNWKLYPNYDLCFYVYAEYTLPGEPPEPEKHLVCYPTVEKRIKSLTAQERLTGLDIQKRKINLEIEKQ